MALDREKSLETKPNLPPEPDFSQEGKTEEPPGQCCPFLLGFPDGFRAFSSRKVKFWVWCQQFLPFCQEQAGSRICSLQIGFFFFLSDHRWAGPCFSLDIPTFPRWSSEMSASYKLFWNKTALKPARIEFCFPLPRKAADFACGALPGPDGNYTFRAENLYF